ncbi:Stf0 family sulfotransferase [Paracoccus sp. TOH]|uniref:Stf0 family sulfotransferase n=1 Tax=Paracoccus sp. TOH TaxID=1263728 RepID=UPI0025B0C747|nr:Stf0 family sulfotransferase [Paracoccus sp. TOH]WJS85329.1 Stf0 family sulfotransferase [Paracoccus sp. TOH]
MSDFLKEAREIVGLPEPAVVRNMPASLAFDQPGHGFQDGLMKSAILCTARSGSSLLSIAMEAYGFRFREYLNAGDLLKKVVVDAAIKYTSELAQPFEQFATQDGRMSIKMPPLGLVFLFMMGEFPKNLDQWRFVYLRRENLVRQAISGAVARKTGQWTHVMAARAEVSDDDYSFDEILRILNSANQENRMIERFIGLLGLPVYNVVYEEFVKNQKPVLAEIAAFFGCDLNDYPEAAQHEPWIERQSTDLNARWEDRFREDLLKRLGVDSNSI